MATRRPTILIACGFALALLTWACRNDGSPRSTSAPVYSSLPNGARSVVHPGVDMPPRYRLVEELRIGAIDGSEEQTFGDIRAVAVDDQDNIHILDFQSQLIRTFSPSGSFVRLTARRGGGPTEIEDANGLMIDVSGTLWVNDPGNGRVIAIEESGVQRASFRRQVIPHRIRIRSQPRVLQGSGCDAAHRWLDCRR